MQYYKNPNLKIIWSIIVLSPFIVAALVSINIVDIPTSNDWIGFYASIIGSLLGGLLTFYSVYLSMDGVKGQIIQQKEANNLLKIQLDNDIKKYKEEQRLSIRPYISEHSEQTDNAINYYAHIFEVDYFNFTYTDEMKIKIKNIGIGPLISLSVIGIRKAYMDDELIEPIHREVKSLEVGGIMNLNISYMTESEYLSAKLDVEIQYYDILDNQYKQVIRVSLFRDESGSYQKCMIESISKQELINNESLAGS
ncbi:hypothetical protein [Clostridium pasteurianum]|uniref:Uncharacterized protein n=1 Tax=Clostridium pasteurianum BC1 TaxID=86416 RepID=R4JYK1_CLOPA|nr:hypothetical protein [Clostridium pasteurianum]AGK95373.1 hypothetical protein Clopa_0311 [Clostridium pasteurianum BC1]